MCISSLNPPLAVAKDEVPGLGATFTHFCEGRYSLSSYSTLTELIETAVEFVSAMLSAAAKSILPLSLAIYTLLSIPDALITAVLEP
jgi:hypothetical protein